MSLPVKTSSLFMPHKPLNSSPRLTTTKSSINCQKPSSESTPDESSTSTTSSSSSAAGVGFGSNKQQRHTASSGKGPRAAVIRRRPPVENPNFVSKPKSKDNGEERGRNESAFVLTWLGLGVVILAQGLTLAASGFLPEEWDKLIVKYVYPIFTPTVGLFVAGSVAYGAVKYLQNDQLKK